METPLFIVVRKGSRASSSNLEGSELIRIVNVQCPPVFVTNSHHGFNKEGVASRWGPGREDYFLDVETKARLIGILRM